MLLVEIRRPRTVWPTEVSLSTATYTVRVSPLTAARLSHSSAAWSDLAQGTAVAREQLWSALAQGAAFTHYFGHGGPEIWADEGLLSVEDAASLPSTGTVVLTWSCQAQFFQYLFGPSVNESLLLKPDGGAVAAFGPPASPTRRRRPCSTEALRRAAAGPRPPRRGDPRAKATAVAEDPRALPVVEGWNLLGDPSLAVELDPAGKPSVRTPGLRRE